ncbi:hypothetical protein DTO166G4_769 [Paecilomyces variotii]|nr:hypothetical protein DTO166G4_769 [Paecilomyces variotii]KAJ9226472.1 hypothetical protein DTO169C6_1200 [Paecilomyces variotii]KAJ9242924.1 hypothetical protein DTO166G5_28 [Paecilomyces variotii]
MSDNIQDRLCDVLGGSLSLLDSLKGILPSMEWKRNVRVGEDDSAIIISAGIANKLTLCTLGDDYSNSDIARHLSEIYDFRFDEKVIDDYRNLKAEGTDEQSDISGIHYDSGEVPVGLLKKALALGNEGFSIEFCIEYFRARYGVTISPNSLEQAVCDLRTIIAEEANRFDNETRAGLDSLIIHKQELNEDWAGISEESQRYLTRLFVGGIANCEASTLRLSGGQFAEQGYATNANDIVLKKRQDLEETIRAIKSGPNPNLVTSNNNHVPMSSSEFSDRLHSLDMKIARLMRSKPER